MIAIILSCTVSVFVKDKMYLSSYEILISHRIMFGLTAISGESLVNEWLHKNIICFTKDLSYANKNLYNEKVEKLDYIKYLPNTELVLSVEKVDE